MSSAIMETQLTRLLNSDEDLRARNLSAVRQPAGGVVLTRGEHHLGIWRWTGAGFSFEPGGSRGPTAEVQTAAEAVIYTQASIAPKP